MTAASSSKWVALRSSHGMCFTVNEASTARLQAIQQKTEENKIMDNAIHFNADASIVSKILDYLKVHAFPLTVDLKSWDSNFIDVDSLTLCHLLVVADKLEIKGLIDLAWDKVAEMKIREMPAEIEMREIRADSPWAFE